MGARTPAGPSLATGLPCPRLEGVLPRKFGPGALGIVEGSDRAGSSGALQLHHLPAVCTRHTGEITIDKHLSLENVGG
jgi:hypothetical protein